MNELLLYGLAKLTVLAFGLPLAFVGPVRDWPVAARISAAFGAGAIALTLHATILSTLRVRWSVPAIAIPLLVLSAALLVIVLRRSSDARPAASPSRAWAGWAIAGAGWLHYALSAVSLRATSADYLYFWGPKAVRFAGARGLDAALLADPYMMHLRPVYPPLVPVGYAWDNLILGRFVWRLEMLDSILWLVAASLVLHAILAGAYGARATMPVGFWTVAIAASGAFSYSVGNAEMPLLFYATAGAAALAVDDRRLRFFGSVMLAGCVLTKSEGRVLWLDIVASLALAMLLRRERLDLRRLVMPLLIPGVSLAVWNTFQFVSGLPLRDEMRQGTLSHLNFAQAGKVAVMLLRFLESGTWWVVWLVPLAILVACRRAWRSAIVPATVSLGVMALYFVHYLAETRPLEIAMWWEVPRISQPSLSLLIVAAALAYAAATPPRVAAE